jgi:hypothetical protein
VDRAHHVGRRRRLLIGERRDLDGDGDRTWSPPTKTTRSPGTERRRRPPAFTRRIITTDPDGGGQQGPRTARSGRRRGLDGDGRLTCFAPPARRPDSPFRNRGGRSRFRRRARRRR